MYTPSLAAVGCEAVRRLHLRVVPSTKRGKLMRPFQCSQALALCALVTWVGCSRSMESSEAPPAASQGDEATPVEPSELDSQSDEEILAILATVDGAEIEQGRLALERAQSPHVREFAGSLVHNHGAWKDEATQVGTTNEMPIETSPLSRELNARATQRLQTLRSADAAVFDRVYVELQVDQHREFLSLLNSRLLTDVDNEALLHQLQAVRDSVADHLTYAEQLARKLR